jgi:hypothetical protein
LTLNCSIWGSQSSKYCRSTVLKYWSARKNPDVSEEYIAYILRIEYKTNKQDELGNQKMEATYSSKTLGYFSELNELKLQNYSLGYLYSLYHYKGV